MLCTKPAMWVLSLALYVLTQQSALTALPTTPPLPKPKTVVTRLGPNATTRGQVNYEDDARPVNIFYGLPYAENPKRFLPAERLKLWSGEYAANNPAKVCKQYMAGNTLLSIPYKVTSGENCLNLDIFTPSVEPTAKLDVMVWIYGGALIRGAAVLYPSLRLPRLHNVVYVAINYRLAGLGFLTTGDENAPGNVGLRDQVEALRWIKRYIHAFGGDPNKVTIFGESAGAMSVSYHLVSPLSKNLFKRAISESGVSTWPLSVLDTRMAINITRKAALQYKCPINDNKSMIQCLRKLPADVFTDPRLFFSPTVDGTFLTESPWNSYAREKFNRKDYLLGFNSHEGYLLYHMFAPMLRAFGMDIPTDINKDTIQRIISGLVGFSYGPDREIIGQVWGNYFGQEQDSDKLYEALIQAVGDMWITGPTVDTAGKHSKKARTYMYYYDYKSLTAWQQSTRPSWVKADHSDEIPRVLGPFQQMFGPVQPSVEDADDKIVSLKMMSYWTNFAKTGNPNGKGLPEWREYDCKKKEYMILNKTPGAAKDYKADRMKLWGVTIPSLDKIHVYKVRPAQWKCSVHWCKWCRQNSWCNKVLSHFKRYHKCEV